MFAAGKVAANKSVNKRLVAEALLAHVLQRGIQPFIVLVTQRDKPERVRAGADLRRKKFHQTTHRPGKRVYLGFSNGYTADALGKLRQTSSERNFLQYRGYLMPAQIEADRFIVRDPYSRRPRLCVRLRKVWHGKIIVFLPKSQKITEAPAQNLVPQLDAGQVLSANFGWVQIMLW